MSVRGRDPSQNKNDREVTAFKQYENDIFLKYDDSPDSTAVSIKEGRIGLHTNKGNVGIIINSNGNILFQGKAVLKVSGKNITKGMFTENDLSLINMTDIGGYPPHTHTLQPAYLFRWPSVDLVSGIKNMLEKFTQLF
jgi:hypothetical protein